METLDRDGPIGEKREREKEKKRGRKEEEKRKKERANNKSPPSPPLVPVSVGSASNLKSPAAALYMKTSPAPLSVDVEAAARTDRVAPRSSATRFDSLFDSLCSANKQTNKQTNQQKN